MCIVANDHAMTIVQPHAVFDKDGDGFITRDELMHVMTSKGERMSEEEARSLIELVDIDGDGECACLFVCLCVCVSVCVESHEGMCKLGIRLHNGSGRIDFVEFSSLLTGAA